jgi:NodT family efflux transporter outer membrane factor (OMF) lipoprotein
LFHSEKLNCLIEAGIDHSPNLKAAKYALKEAQATLYAQVASTLLPAFSGQFSGERERFSSSTFGVNNPGNDVFNLFNASVNVSYTLDFFGGLRRQIEAFDAQVDYELYLLESAYLTLAANIATTAITIASLEAQIGATHALIKAQVSQLKIIQQQFRLGGVSRADVLSQQSQVAQTEATLPPLQQSLAQNQHALSVLIGEFPSDDELPTIRLSDLTLPKNIPIGLPSFLVRQRPDIRASEALLHAASAQIGVATANMYPQFTLTGNYGWQSTILQHLFKPDAKTWMLLGTFTEPIFNGGALLAKKRAAVYAYKQALAQYQQTVLQGFQNVADSLRALQHDALELKAQKEAEVAAKRSLFLIQNQFRLGGQSYLSLLNAQRQYQQAIIGRIRAQAARYTDTVALFQSLGGGWWNQEPVCA